MFRFSKMVLVFGYKIKLNLYFINSKLKILNAYFYNLEK